MSLLTIGRTLAVVGGLGIIAVGVSYLLAPQAIAKGFGLPDWPRGDASAWLRIKGVRDIVSGLVVLVPLALGLVHMLGWIVLVVAITPIGDAIIVLRHHGNRVIAYGMHGGTAVVVVVTAILLLVGA